ncbi:hypothetical protein LDO31_01820 [Luteimonas sp. XNQY3]|nr:hypothetical protein [Luteimonas sp. XNQY3]MCD9004989.1 hypothetical protein [Luteimonas sp. XNQY3]
MNDFDDLMQMAWQKEQPRDGAALVARVRRHRWRHRVWRSMEIALTLFAIAVLVRMASGDTAGPAYWLVMPFFVVYLPAAWWLLLRAPRPHANDATQDVRTYAHVRLSQLRSGLRDLRLARITAVGLLAYAVLAASGAFLLGDATWRAAALWLLAYAGAWTVTTFWLSQRRRRLQLREYRAMRRLAGPAA